MPFCDSLQNKSRLAIITIMSDQTGSELRALLDRIARMHAAEDWASDLNPAQRSTLDYLARANRFSRAPSHVADYLCTTRGTASQSLKALERKRLVETEVVAGDRRSKSYRLTAKGRQIAGAAGALDAALEDLRPNDAEALRAGLDALARSLLSARNHRPFGLCKTCKFHQLRPAGAHCALLDTPLADQETIQICHEHTARAAPPPHGT